MFSLKRILAQALYRLGGWLSHVKTPQRSYVLVSIDPFVTEPSERQWRPCKLSMSVLKASMRLDWWHWGHWALVHEDCGGQPCAVCGGIDCGN